MIQKCEKSTRVDLFLSWFYLCIGICGDLETWFCEENPALSNSILFENFVIGYRGENYRILNSQILQKQTKQFLFLSMLRVLSLCLS